MLRNLRGEQGTVLPMALILLAVGSILLTPMLAGVSSRLVSARNSGFAALEGYAADAGVEDAIWSLVYDDLDSEIPNVDDSTSYSVDDPVNGSSVNATVTNKGTVLAADDFESGDWSGGTGWPTDWSVSGAVDVTGGEEPYEGNYHLRIRSSTGYVERSVDTSNQPALTLQLWRRVKIFEPGDEAELKLSSDGTDWTVARTWTSADSDDTYHYEEFDLSPYVLSNQLWVAIDAEMTNPGDKFFIDDLKITRPPVYEVVVDAGDHTTTVLVAIDNGDVTILSWDKD